MQFKKVLFPKEVLENIKDNDYFKLNNGLLKIASSVGSGI